MAREIRSLNVVVNHSVPTFHKTVVDQWGREGGDYREYLISATGDYVSLRSGSKLDLSGSSALLVELAEAILEVVAAQTEAEG